MVVGVVVVHAVATGYVLLRLGLILWGRCRCSSEVRGRGRGRVISTGCRDRRRRRRGLSSDRRLDNDFSQGGRGSFSFSSSCVSGGPSFIVGVCVGVVVVVANNGLTFFFAQKAELAASFWLDIGRFL